MNNTHDQAMHYVYQQVLQRIFEHLNQAQRASIQLLMQRLLVIAGGHAQIADLRLVLLHGGDQRSAHLLAYLRAAQLSIALRHHATFRLRVLIARSPGLDRATLASHERCFSALFLHDDPRVELLLSDGERLEPFIAGETSGCGQLGDAGKAWLLFGHLSGGQPDALLGGQAYLMLAEGLSQALAGADPEGGVDALVTVAPAVQRRRLLAWARRCLSQACDAAPPALPQCVRVLTQQLAQLRYRLDDPAPSVQVALPAQAARPLRVVAVDDLLQLDDGASLEHMLGRREVLPCQLQGLAGLFDPLALAHLHGLHGQYVSLLGYREGVQGLLQRLGQSQLAWPEEYSLQAQASFAQAYGVSEEQLVCLLLTPFEARGRNLERYVQRCHPRMRVALPYLHRALQGRPCPALVSQWLVDVSGLELVHLRALYAGTLPAQVSLQAQVLARRDLWLRLLPLPAQEQVDPQRLRRG
ncbi:MULTISPECIES: hypothetical protein [Pseudomonas]|uniref:Uncharacterized protein n=1 Tax=Pseudomonas entomophila TaxID=312306 RepID=A0A3S8UL46_9PSED|nr:MULTISPECIES: hypothetical protein [Pseudomonas]AZL68977.1 hypothetical protein EJA05_15095 [Pseudomonas oryziphila]MDZ4021348.1 hypothetical protein [Pseudomonas sichuanensis]MDZ4022076.1 hypothetical protein [Pseudomonas sichuanensis]UVL87058.1 hypothetical protein LOY51_14710 [Pseudomonas sichuanensis]